MSFAKIYSAQATLLGASIIEVETDLSKGLHSFAIVGLPDKAVEESRDRVAAAIKNSGFSSPKSKNQKVVVSLAPADTKKEGPVFDVAIALSYLLAAGEIKCNPKKKIFLGELALDGTVRRINGVIAAVREAVKRGFEEIYVPKENAKEAALIKDITIFGVETLEELIGHIQERREAGSPTKKINPQPATKIEALEQEPEINFGDIYGQESAKRGLLIAAAGGHNIALYGPPGTGKSMLAKAFRGALPQLSYEEMLEVTSIHSVAGSLSGDLVVFPPFRSPHHTSSYVSLIGGGAIPKPGEITLAHRGVLFLDEFPEFDRRVIEALRQPLEDHTVSVARARGSHTFPAHFILVAALNPCPCGNFGSNKECVCTPLSLTRYQRKMSGPIMDRIDLWIEVGRIPIEKLSSGGGKVNETLHMQKGIAATRKIQLDRFSGGKRRLRTNSEMNSREINTLTPLKEEVKNLLNISAEKLSLSPRSYHKVIKVARTIADLEESENVEKEHLLEALQYRPKIFTH